MIYIGRDEALAIIKTELATTKNRDTAVVLEKIIAAIREIQTFTDNESFNKLWAPGFKIQPRKVNIKDLINAIDEDTDIDVEDEATGNYISATAFYLTERKHGKNKKVGLITNTYLKEVPGMFYTSEGLQPLPVAVRFTSDRTGETLSLAVREDDREKGVQIIIEFSNIEDLIKTTRAARTQES